MKIKLLLTGLLIGTTTSLNAATNDLSGLLQKGLFEEEANRNLDAASAAYETLVKQFDKDRQVGATAVFRLGEVYRKQGKTNEAVAQYERIVRDFAEQTTLVTLSRQNLAGLVVKSGSIPTPLATSATDVAIVQQALVITKASISDLQDQITRYQALPETNRLASLCQLFANDAVLGADCQAALEIKARLNKLLLEGHSTNHPSFIKQQTRLASLGTEIETKAQKRISSLPQTIASLEAQVETLQRQGDLYEKRMSSAVAPALPDASQLSKMSQAEIRQVLPTLVPDQLLMKLLEQLGATETKLAELKQDFGPDHPEIKRLVAVEKTVNRQIDERVAGIIKALELRGAASDVSKSTTAVTTVVDEEESEIRRIQGMIQNSPDLINATSGDPARTPLGRAAEKGQLRVAEYLLSNGADVNFTSQGWTPLCFAAQNGHKKMVELLVARGANVEARAVSKTALHIAVSRNFPAVVESLLAAKADPNSRDNGDNTPLMAAVLQGSVPMAKALLARAADVNLVNKAPSSRNFPGASTVNAATDRPNYGSALHLAVGRGNLAMTQLLLTNRADVARRSIFGETALHVAAASGRTDVAALLIAAGADVNAAGAEDQTGGATPLHLATIGGYREAVKLLLEKAANPNVTAGRPGVTPLMSAASGKDAELITLLLKHKADLNLVGANGNFALLNAVMQRNPETVRALLAGGADPDMLNPNRYPLLVLAVTDAANKEVAQALIEARANVNAPDPIGRTPLHWAASANREELVGLLVKAGADVNLQDKDGRTALDLVKSGRSASTPGAGFVSIPGPIAPRGQPVSAKSTEPKPEDVGTLLRKHGALDNLPAFDRIQITRPAVGLAKTIFKKGRIEVSSFTLLDVFGVQYQFLNEHPGAGLGKRDDPRLLAMNDFRSDAFSFPDLTKVRLRRPSPDGKKWDDRLVDVAALLRDGDCSQNLELKWGDEIVIPETDHGLGERWNGFSRAGLKTFNKCLTRTVEIVVKGQAAKVTIGPKFESLENSSSPGYVTTGASLWLRPVLYGSNLLLASSDLARVKVTRAEPGAGKLREWVLDCSSDKSPEFWLCDGDVVEVPDKP